MIIETETKTIAFKTKTIALKTKTIALKTKTIAFKTKTIALKTKTVSENIVSRWDSVRQWVILLFGLVFRTAYR